jgi:predicted lipoprotein with Yx(FWY)xxD motif
MRSISLLLFLAAALAIASCGGDDDAGEAAGAGAEKARMKDDAAMKKDEPAMKKEDDAMGKSGTTITLQDSDFGPMLFDSNKQAIYIFERDARNKTVCYGKCAKDWPPVFTDGQPRAADGVRAALLGTIKRRDGRTQVTYAGRPLYFYSHEDPGIVLCHNVDLNGGYWWAIGADGRRRPA